MKLRTNPWKHSDNTGGTRVGRIITKIQNVDGKRERWTKTGKGEDDQ